MTEDYLFKQVTLRTKKTIVPSNRKYKQSPVGLCLGHLGMGLGMGLIMGFGMGPAMGFGINMG